MTVKNKTNKNYKKSQKGRSMVEMLGVLAIVGVLSVGGVYGYGVAMKKHKANELLHQASMLAATISAQAMTNDGKLPETITSFGNSSYGTFSTSTTDALDGKGFSITIENVDSAVCDQLKEGGMIQKVECKAGTSDGKKNAEITYYKNLATTEAEGEKSPIGEPQEDMTIVYDYPCPEGSKELRGPAFGEVCAYSQAGASAYCAKDTYGDYPCADDYEDYYACTSECSTCPSGTSTKGAGGEVTDSYGRPISSTDGPCYCETADTAYKDGTCKPTCSSYANCDKEEYCDYETESFGVCNSLSNCDLKKDIDIGDGKKYATACYVTWWAAKDICESLDMHMVSLSEVGCENHKGDSFSPDEESTLSALRDKGIWDFWTTNLSDESNPDSGAWYVTIDGSVSVESGDRSSDKPVLCVR